MPPRLRSRHSFTAGFKDEDDDRLQLTDREPFLFESLSDNRQHRVSEGDTLHQLAARYFTPLEGAANLWWIIADFQPDPIHDPTIKLTNGSILIIPSIRTVQERIFDAARLDEAGL